jgi:hypothetical protein
MDTPWDEYDAYDLSEFSNADFVFIDSNTTGATTRHNHNRVTTPEEEQLVVITGGDRRRAVGTPGGSGGLPRVSVELEPAVKVAGGGSGSGDSIVTVGGASRSPFEEFRSQIQTLSVSDLVGPAWYTLFFSFFFSLVPVKG